MGSQPKQGEEGGHHCGWTAQPMLQSSMLQGRGGLGVGGLLWGGGGEGVETLLGKKIGFISHISKI